MGFGKNGATSDVIFASLEYTILFNNFNFKPYKYIKMKSVKSLLAVVCFAMISNFAIAAGTPNNKKPEGAQIQAYLKGIDFNKMVKADTKVNISFMINAQNEILVVSTNNKDLDGVLKSALNYKSISVSELEYNKIYTVPVLLK